MTGAPIIFIHYGNASYLPFVLKAARSSNPDKEIILLGDESNRHLARHGIRHCHFANYDNGEEIATFRQVFQLIKGADHNYQKLRGADHWTNFVFLRWFLIGNFLRSEGIGPFWTFDSDTLILAPLGPREARFASYDCTEQCVAQCMNGFVSGLEVVTGYIRKINELFQRPEYLQRQREILIKSPGLAFTEMNAYVTFREEAGLNTYPLNRPLEGEAFDDSLCFPQGYETHSEKVKGRLTIKNLLLDPRPAIFITERSSQALVRLLTLNLSWMPDYIFKRLMPFVGPDAQIISAPSKDDPKLRLLDVSEPLASQAQRMLKIGYYRLGGLNPFSRRTIKP